MLEICSLNIPREALDLLMFEIHHERNNSWDRVYPERYQTMQNGVFEKNGENLRFVYDNLELRYQKVKRYHVELAGLLMLRLAQTGFWRSASESEARSRLDTAQAQCPMTSVMPVVARAEALIDKVPSSLPSVRRSGLIPFVRLSLMNLKRYLAAETDQPQPMAPENIPLTAFFDHPEQLTEALFPVVRERLAEINHGQAVRELVRHVASLEGLKRLLQNHSYTQCRQLNCFDDIQFQPFTLTGSQMVKLSFKRAIMTGCCFHNLKIIACDFSRSFNGRGRNE